MSGFSDCKTLDDSMLLVGLDRLGIGCGLFDLEQRLICCNKTFSVHGAYPEALCRSGASLGQLQRFRRERAGQDHEPDQALETPEDAPAGWGRIAWRDPSGRTIEQRLASLDRRGLVLISTDITDHQACTVDLSLAHDAARNALEDLQTARQQLDDAERLAALGELTAGVAHEIKNPLNFVNNFAQLSAELIDELVDILGPTIKELEPGLRAEVGDMATTLEQNLLKINQHGRQADAIVRTMLLHARCGPDQVQTVPLNALVDEVVNLARQDLQLARADRPVDLRSSLAPDVGEIECYPKDLMRALFNLVANGIHAAGERCDGVRPAVVIATCAGEDTVDIVIEDNGAGMQAEVIEQAFTPFFTTKPPGEGTGLGLSLSHDLISRQHRGDLKIVSQVDRYTRATVTLPTCLPDRRHKGRRHDDG